MTPSIGYRKIIQSGNHKDKTMKHPARPPVSKAVRQRLVAAGVSFRANENIADHLRPGELNAIEAEVAGHVERMLESLLIDTASDHNTQGTAARVARMFVREVFAGRYEVLPNHTDFPNVGKLDELYAVGPVAVRSACSHHLCPIEGDLWCGVIPGKRVLGLSKFSRIARWVMARPQIQEEAIVQLADLLEEKLEPRGLAVVMKARHTCMTWRGVREHDTVMTSSVTRGMMRESPASRQEFFSIIGSQRFACQTK